MDDVVDWHFEVKLYGGVADKLKWARYAGN